MARGINKCILVGNLGQDPESKSFTDGGSVCNISIATSESWKDKQTNEPVEKTEWHRVVFRNKLAEIAQQYLRKGSKVYIEGSLRTRKWTNQQGAEQFTTEIIANVMQMLDGKAEGDQGGYGQAAAAQAPAGVAAAAEPQAAPQAPVKLIMTPKANGVTYEAYMQQGSWTNEALIAQGLAQAPAPQAAPVNQAPAQQQKKQQAQQETASSIPANNQAPAPGANTAPAPGSFDDDSDIPF